MAKKSFLDRYKRSSLGGAKKRSKSLSFDADILEALEHNAQVANISLSTLVQDAIIEVGLDKKVEINDQK